MSKFNNLQLILFIVFITFTQQSCNKLPHENDFKDTDWGNQETSTPEAKQKLEKLREKIDFYYSSNPDSSIYYCHKLIEAFNQENIPSGKMNIYNLLSEIYLHRKSDPINAIRYYSESLKLMQKNNWRETTNPYFFIDMGNLQLATDLNNEAIESYHKALQISKNRNRAYEISLSVSNLGIVFQKVKNFDSAYFYYREAIKYRKDVMPLLVAQSQVSLANLFIDHMNADSVLHYRNEAHSQLKKQKYTVSALMPLPPAYALDLYQSIKNNLLYLTALYSEHTGQLDKAIKEYKFALKKLSETDNYSRQLEYYYRLTQILDAKSSKKEALQTAKFSYDIALKHRDFEYAVKFAKLLAKQYEDMNIATSNFYLKKTIELTDSLMDNNEIKRKQHEMILLIEEQTQDSLFYYKLVREKNQSIIKTQSTSIAILALLSLILAILIYFIIKKNKQLKDKHIQQMELILKDIEKEDRQMINVQPGGVPEIAEYLENGLAKLMYEQKIFTQKNLTLSILAHELDTNVSYLSQYINNQLQSNFNDYINSYRVKEACRIFKTDTALKYTIDQVAEMSGFSSRSTFYSAFKKVTGITPAFFQKNVANIQLSA